MDLVTSVRVFTSSLLFIIAILNTIITPKPTKIDYEPKYLFYYLLFFGTFASTAALVNIGFEIIEVVKDSSHPGMHYILIEQVTIILQLLFLSYLMYIKLPELKIKLDSLEKTIRYIFYVGALYMVLEDLTIDPVHVHLISSAAITMLVIPAIYLLIPLYRYIKLMGRGDIVFPATLSANLENICYIGMFSSLIVFSHIFGSCLVYGILLIITPLLYLHLVWNLLKEIKTAIEQDSLNDLKESWFSR